MNRLPVVSWSDVAIVLKRAVAREGVGGNGYYREEET